MMHKLFIDDIRDPIDETSVIARSYEIAVLIMTAYGCPDEISFDHDLGTADAKTGYDIAKWMVERDLDQKFIPEHFEYYVHSANPVGAANIKGLLNNYLMKRQA